MIEAEMKEDKRNINSNNKIILNLSLLLVFVILVIKVDYLKEKIQNVINLIEINNPINEFKVSKVEGIEKFKSSEEFRSYIEEQENNLVYSQPIGEGSSFEVSPKEVVSMDAVGDYSKTNIQVPGVDEADIVKTDGKNIYYSHFLFQQVFARSEEMVEKGIVTPQSPTGRVAVLGPENGNILKISEVMANGELYLDDNMLIVLDSNKLTGWDVEDPANPEQKWTLNIDGSQYLVSSRMKDGKIYAVFKTMVTSGTACPLILSDDYSVNCNEIYYAKGVSADSVFTAISINVMTGETEQKISFMGSDSLSYIYMSKDNIYISYRKFADIVRLYIDFFENEGEGLINDENMLRLKELEKLDISKQSKYTELGVILEKELAGLGQDERMRKNNQMQNKLNEYSNKRVREYESTGIVKIDLNGFSILANGSVPGNILNQFSMDEHNGYFRVATTSEALGETSVNDVYVLDENLITKGSILDLGVDEQIYSVRFMGEIGYVVTFKNTDPFYVLDLKDPNNPILAGELKIPGYSSYLHPLGDDHILGIGKEDTNLKVSLFNVKDLGNPKEESKYLLDDYSSETLYNHHAFVVNEENRYFAIPGSNGLYVFSFKENNLDLLFTLSEQGAKRSVYIGEYLYVFLNQSVVVVDTNRWQRSGEILLY